MWLPTFPIYIQMVIASFINKKYIAMLQRSKSIMQYKVIALTYKIKAAGSRRVGEIMVSCFLFLCVLCWLRV
jgi:hypothetical protein